MMGNILTIVISALATVISISYGVKIFRRVKIKRKELREYEFENRTDGGVVKFDDFEASEAHKKKYKKIDALMTVISLWVIIGLIAVSVFWVALISSFY